MTDVQGRCPACGGNSLFLGEGGYVTCPRIDCPEPDAASTLLEKPAVPSQSSRQRRDDWMRTARGLGALSATFLGLAVVAAVQWARGSGEALSGTVVFVGGGALLAWAARSIWSGERD
jgi:hypothetical protein